MKKEKELLVAVASQKGGVGKSVFTVLLASVLHYHKGLRVAVVDCDSPQHSIALMRERDIENVMKNDDLKVGLYRQHERIQKPAYPVIKSDPEKPWRTCGVIPWRKARLSMSCFSTSPERSAARVWSIPSPRWTTGVICKFSCAFFRKVKYATEYTSN